MLVDARNDLSAARGLGRLRSTAGRSVPVLAVVSEGGLVAVSADWGLDEIPSPMMGRPRLTHACGLWSVGVVVWLTRRASAR